MAQSSISDLYRGEGPGEKYGGILNAVFHEFFTKGIPEECCEQTWIELLTVKHTFFVAERMKKEGDVVSELSEAASPFCCAKMKENCSGAHCAPQFPTRRCNGAQRAPGNQNRSSAPRTPDGTRGEVTE